jgi:leader peptidase (prepilin peptidase)/N-methyltransferase
VIEATVALVFGLLMGSFLNVCIHRWPRGRSVVRPRSHCVRCRKMIPWYDNVPVLSYLVLRGRCRYCGRRISPRYPLVELAVGLLFFYFVATMGPTAAALKMCVFTAMLVALTFSDLEKRILPDELTLGGALLGLVFALFVPVPDVIARLFGLDVQPRLESLVDAAIGAIPAFFLWSAGWIYEKVRHREGLGLGDVKLMVMVGVFLGLHGALYTLVLGALSGSIVGLLYIKLTRQDASTYELPFGTFLGIAGLAVAVFGL